jgi:S-DNA-T family DNA segregation ATPase FtsK/SpoIIIE
VLIIMTSEPTGPPTDNGGELVPFPGTPVPDGADTSYEVALDDEPDGAAVPVHEGAAVALLPLDGERRPIIPAHLRTVTGIGKTLGRHLGSVAYEAGFQLVRSPLTIGQWIAWALWGVVVVLERIRRWWWVSEQAYLRSQAVIAGDSREWRSLHSTAQKTRSQRGMAIGACAFGVLFAGDLIARFAPWWAWLIVAAAALPLLARAGRPADRSLFTPSLVTPRFRVINSDVVLRAYYAAKLGEPSDPGEPGKPGKGTKPGRAPKPSQEITFGSRMERDGEGSRVVVNLPYGRTLSEAMDAREKLASGLDVAMSQVFIHRYPASNRSHVLWVADRDPLAVPVGRTPLLACKPTDIWKPAPLGLDERGRPVSVPLMWNSVLVGALPRMGKTFAARLLGLYAALDPYVKLSVFDPSGKPDWRDFAMVADSCAFGLTPSRAGLPPEILRDTLLEVKADVQDRYERLSAMPTSVCPLGKLTREIARDPRYEMPVRGLILDEFQEYFDLGSISKEIAGLLVFITKVAPGAGVWLLDATQKPSGIGKGDVATAFTSARDNHQVRFSLRTSSYSVSEAVLGQGAYGEGLDSSTLLPEYKGVGILRGASDASPTVRTYLADGDDAKKILTAARALRERAGTLSGMAAGLDMGQDDRDVLADVLQVFGTDNGLHWQVLAARLATQIPDRWADTSAEAVSAECRALGVPSVDVKAFGKALKGCRRADVETAVGR